MATASTPNPFDRSRSSSPKRIDHASSSDTPTAGVIKFMPIGRDQVLNTPDTFEFHTLQNGFPTSPDGYIGRLGSVTQDDVFYRLLTAMPDLQYISSGARKATKAEQKMTPLTACRRYPKAIIWSIILSCTIIMEGYDTVLIYSFFSYPSFQQKYGGMIMGGAGQQTYAISTAWQSALVMGATVGQIIGLFTNGFLTDKIGYHHTMVGAVSFLTLAIFVSFFAVNIQMLLVAQILCGIPWGIFQTLSTTYAAEVVPVTLRAYLLSSVNMCWLIGQVIGAGILRGFADTGSEWSYRIPFALQWAFALPILLAVLFAPESPWWLIRHNRPGEARKSLLRLTKNHTGTSDGFNVDETLAMMQHTNEVEKRLGGGHITYLDCFKGTNLRRTEIACMVWTAQRFSGATLSAYAAFFYEQAGFAINNAFNLQLGMYGLGILGGIIAFFIISSVGRRTLFLCGLLVSVLILFASGIVSLFPLSKMPAQPWVIGSLIIVLTFVYDLTVGPVCYILVAEVPSTRLRVKTVVLARLVYNLGGIVTSVLAPEMLDPTSWNWKGKACFLFAGTAFLCLIWCLFRLPELFGLSYLEIDILFEKRAKISKFQELQARLAASGYFNFHKFEREAGIWKGY